MARTLIEALAPIICCCERVAQLREREQGFQEKGANLADTGAPVFASSETQTHRPAKPAGDIACYFGDSIRA